MCQCILFEEGPAHSPIMDASREGQQRLINAVFPGHVTEGNFLARYSIPGSSG